MTDTREYVYNGSSGTKLEVTITTTATNVTNNTTTEQVLVKFVHPGESWNATSYTMTLNFNGKVRTKSFNYGAYANITLFNFTQVVGHDNNGTKTARLTITDDRHNSPLTTTISVDDNFVLDTIPRHTTITSYYIDEIGFTSYRLNWTTSDTIDQVQRYTSVSGWETIWTDSGVSGSWVRTGLEPGTLTGQTIRVRRADSGLYTQSAHITATTKQIAKLTYIPDNIDITKPFTVYFDRNDASTVELGIYDTAGGGTFAQYVTVAGSSHTFDLNVKISPSDTRTPAERMYDDMSNTNSRQYLIFIATDWNIHREAHGRVFIIRNAEPSTPVFTHQDINNTTFALTANRQKYIQNYSELEVTLTTATPFRGATITKYIIINGSNSKEYASSGTNTIGLAVSNQLQVIVEDSRGNRSQAISTLDYIPYTQPIIQNFVLNKQIGTGTSADLVTNGLYLDINFGAVQNKIKAVECRGKSTGGFGVWHDITSLVLYGNGTFNNSAIATITGFTFGLEYIAEIKISDELSFNIATTSVSRGLFTALSNPEYGSIGIGEIPLKEINSVKVKGNVYAPNINPAVIKRVAGINLNYNNTWYADTDIKNANQVVVYYSVHPGLYRKSAVIQKGDTEWFWDSFDTLTLFFKVNWDAGGISVSTYGTPDTNARIVGYDLIK